MTTKKTFYTPEKMVSDVVLHKLTEIRQGRNISGGHMVSIDTLSHEDIDLILGIADVFHEAKSEKIRVLSGHTIINAFFEDSTRTRSSFELAAKHLGADTLHITSSGSSTKKGESLLDTALTLTALQASAVVVRSGYAGLPQFLSRYLPIPVLNAGDSWHEHPSQALLDVKTMRDHHGKLEGKVVTIIGDIVHSRVTGSLLRILQKLNVRVRICCPETLLPKSISQFGVQHFARVEDAVENTDVVYAMRVKAEYGAKGFLPSLREYARDYCVTPKRFVLAHKNAILMDAGPVIRGLSVSDALMTHDRCRVLEQVENGLAVRKALLWLMVDRKGEVQNS